MLLSSSERVYTSPLNGEQGLGGNRYIEPRAIFRTAGKDWELPKRLIFLFHSDVHHQSMPAVPSSDPESLELATPPFNGYLAPNS